MRTLWALGLLVALLAVLPAQAQLQPVPALTGHLVDHAGMLDADQQSKLEATLADYEAKTGSQIAVLTVKSTEPEAIEQFSIRVVEAWKLGRKGVDDGVLLMVALNNPPALRRLRIEAGRGVQGTLTDAQSKRVLQDVIAPHFRDKDYYGGLNAGVGAIATLLNAEKFPAPVQPPAPAQASSQSGGGGFPIGALIAIGIGFMVLRGVFGGRGRGASLGRGSWGSGATGFVIGNILANAGRGGGGFGGGGFGGSGGSGGGFSGGGGSFDGGGASGDW